MKPCELCGAIHESFNCEDRDMTVIGICRTCAGLMRECYRHKTNGIQHLTCIGHTPVSYAYYLSQVKFLNENAEYCNKLIPIPAHVTIPEDFDGKKAN
jgi:hypothetical protein